MDWYEDEARFMRSDFDAKQYVMGTFAEETADEALNVRRDLLEKKQETAAQLVELVKKNYFQFLDTAQESNRIEEQLAGLRGMFTELHGTLVSMKSIDFGFETRKTMVKNESAAVDKEAEVWKQRVAYVAEAELELDVLLSERRLEAAVALLEQARGPLEVLRRKIHAEHEQDSPDLVTLQRIEARISQVADALTMQLTSPAISASEARVVFGLLKRMHLEAKAKEVFLSGRSQHILAEIKQLKPDADRVAFVRSLSRQVFFSLRDSCADFVQCFGESSASLSYLSVWCMKEIRLFGALWIRFVISRGEFESVVHACLKEALSYVRVLEEFGFYFEQYLRNQLLNAVVEKYEKIVLKNVKEKMANRLVSEDWYALPQTGALGTMNLLPKNSKKTWLLTPSAVYCINSVYSFVSEAVNFLPHDLIRSISKIGFHLLETYFQTLYLRLETPLDDAQLLGILGNVVTIVSVLGKELDAILVAKNSPPKFEALLSQLFSEFCLKLCEKKAHFLLFRSWQFSHLQYSDIRAKPTASSRQAIKLFDWIMVFQTRLVEHITSVAGNAQAIANSILVQLLAGIVALIREAEDFWEQIGTFSQASVIQFCLDLRWMQEASKALQLSTPKLLRDIEASVQRVILEYCSHTGEKNPKKMLQAQGEFFPQILEEQLKNLVASRK